MFLFLFLEHLKLLNLTVRINKELQYYRLEEILKMCTWYMIFPLIPSVLGFCFASVLFGIFCLFLVVPASLYPLYLCLFLSVCRIAMVIPWMAGERFQLALCKSSDDCLLYCDLDFGCQILS